MAKKMKRIKNWFPPDFRLPPLSPPYLIKYRKKTRKNTALVMMKLKGGLCTCLDCV
jgi:hypothetical protein